MSTVVTGPAPMVPSLVIPGFADPFMLAADTADLAMKGNVRSAVLLAGFNPDKVRAIATSWSILTERPKEAAIWDEETEDFVATLGVVFARRSVTVTAPVDKAGKPVPVPHTVTVSAFQKTEKDRTVTLAEMARAGRAERKDGKLTGRILPVPPLSYGTTEYRRPSGATFLYSVAILPSADRRKWRIAAGVAN